MRDRERLSLERELREDYDNLDSAATARLDELVTAYLHHKIKLLTGANTRTERDVLDLIHLHARAALLEAVVERPKQFNLKEMKELFRSTLIVEANDAAEKAKTNPIALLRELGVDDEKKAEMFNGLTELAKERVRAQIAERTDAG